MTDYLILQVNKPDSGHLKRLSLSLAAALDASVELASGRLIPKGTEVPGRGQYNSTEILRLIADKYQSEPFKVIGVTELDLCIPILTYVFGEAQLNGQAAVVSTFRLDPAFYGLPRNDALYEERILLESLHELGHTFGLHHCKNWQCVMHTANDVDEIDIRGKHYCDECRLEVMADK